MKQILVGILKISILRDAYEQMSVTKKNKYR